ncbi:MAG: phospholipid carrier-dependent glycosyltransferase [Pseudanabaena sp.]|jgi:dolichyl-phosphate-mannose-protein mannosyltransferase|nr:phospholipid carrier-dependent glycosyltransferase [Pseudanabaena sp. M090S1SP2A07QC]MCA6507161.1 phospholipid carrier-dependent glycosyltransferase [Pseudanabaena sp. M172S2SP2A07QC]MCA6509145.1 phospholipid carrier-dependent glycosyltransferase [Pseudanabaena sp. M109S1SP2A07QC]MCA6522601.1 phospholipid carrier-dependent glycosyltransferase [Pseudanabaena sp. M051S1SP2A07QC]MCA6530614.1 phospholipid carrier-dependent glycosyltransferase [Pseudanabaena sp. M125S2SP2A07QC]MCA6535751.1 phosp
MAIALVAFATRFWNLDGTADVVFDEVYYPKFAQNYLRGETLFDAHPPLAKYIIAIGIKIFGYAPFGYRCMTALAGSLLPLITYELFWQLSDRRGWSWLAGWFIAMDGLLLVESRFGLINIYILLFGMLSHLCIVLALKRSRQRWFWVLATGLMLGASISVKWTGLAYVVGLIALMGYAWSRYRQTLNVFQILIGLIILPIAFYFVEWIPHLLINPERDIWELHRQILGFHQNLGVGKTEPIHPYCSPWWSWVLLIRPVAYFFEMRPNSMVQFVHAMGNPLLYWLSAISLLLGLSFLVASKIRFPPKLITQINLEYSSKSPSTLFWLTLYVITSFLAHWLPWSLSKRCIFLYHYMPASVFAFATLALLVSLMWRSPLPELRRLGSGIVATITIAFIFWLPIYIGLPISSGYLPVLMWLTSWI